MSENWCVWQLAPSEVEGWRIDTFGPGARNPQGTVAAALMLAEAAIQRGLIFKPTEAWKEFMSTPQRHTEFVKGFAAYLFDGPPFRIDLLTWDRAGCVQGWYTEADGAVNEAYGSCPNSVRTLGAALAAFAPLEEEWRPLLESCAREVTDLWSRSRQLAGTRARDKVQKSGRVGPEAEALELGGLGFTDELWALERQKN